MNDFSAALAAVASLAGNATLELHDDDYDSLRYEWDVGDAIATISGASGAAAKGWVVSLHLEDQHGGVATLLHEPPDRWLAIEGDPAALLDHVRGAANHRSTAELLATGAAAAFGALASVRGDAGLKKDSFRAEIAQETGRGVWLGPSQDGFAAWLKRVPAESVAATLFEHPGAVVLLEDWAGPPRGVALTMGGLGVRPASIAPDPILIQRLTARDELSRLPSWQILGVDPLPLPIGVQVPLQRVIGLCAVRLLASPRDGAWAPCASHEKTWQAPATAGNANGDFTGITALVRWVAADLSEARMEVAREIAAARIDDPATNTADVPLVQAAQFALTLHVQRNVRESLDRQQKLEESFRELDEKVAALRDKQADALDGTLTKVVAAALAVTISALTSAKVRDWPATWAALVLAAYLLLGIKATWTLRSEALERLSAASKLASNRVEGLGTELASIISEWERDMKRRACFAISVLAVATVLVVAAGIAQNGKLFGSDDDTKSKTTTTTGTSTKGLIT